MEQFERQEVVERKYLLIRIFYKDEAGWVLSGDFCSF